VKRLNERVMMLERQLDKHFESKPKPNNFFGYLPSDKNNNSNVPAPKNNKTPLDYLKVVNGSADKLTRADSAGIQVDIERSGAE